MPPAPARPLPGRKRTRARLRAPAFSARCSPQTRAYGPRRHMPRRPIGWGTQQAQETGAHALQPPAGEPGRGCARLAGAQQAHCRQQGHATAAPMAPKRDRRPALTEGYPAVQLARLQRRYSACLAPRRRSSSDHRCFRKSRSRKNPRARFREIGNSYGPGSFETERTSRVKDRCLRVSYPGAVTGLPKEQRWRREAK